MLYGGNRLVLHEVPFVDYYHEALLVFLNERENVYVLRLNASCCINHEYTYVGGFDGAYRAYYRVVFYVFVYFVFLADAGGVDQIEVEAEF